MIIATLFSTCFTTRRFFQVLCQSVRTRIFLDWRFFFPFPFFFFSFETRRRQKPIITANLFSYADDGWITAILALNFSLSFFFFFFFIFLPRREENDRKFRFFFPLSEEETVEKLFDAKISPALRDTRVVAGRVWQKKRVASLTGYLDGNSIFVVARRCKELDERRGGEITRLKTRFLTPIFFLPARFARQQVFPPRVNTIDVCSRPDDRSRAAIKHRATRVL